MQSTKIILKLGERNRCHDNAQKLYQEHPNRYRLAYGYALSEDGLWRQHSWLIRKSDNAIMETTEKRLRYFGYFPEEEATL